ncbi:hypothetical protein JF710_21865 [Mycobacterium intracellulare]|uniref:hypothetical protein n=1 Tax=Mycobacterium intracellulare TaxID=1767 RepID=UPI001CDA7979|nr:hypothetical protein [Mycobacterium intracellulare]MCA2255831.1 hypothetical protein [Mycobacterium intracellulare]
MPKLDEDQKKALGLAIGLIETLTDAGYERDEQDQNALDLLDRYQREHGGDSDSMVWGGLTTLAIILVKKVAEASGTTTDDVLQAIANEHATRGA